MELDRIDRALLDALQADCTLSVAALGALVGLSATPCWKRLRRLEEAGVIQRRVAVLDRRRVGLPVTVFVSVRTSRHDEQWLGQFAAAVLAMPEVLEAHRMSGDVDYLLKVACADIDGYDRFYKRLIRIAPLSGVSSAFSMERLKDGTALPLDAVASPQPPGKKPAVRSKKASNPSSGSKRRLR